MFYETDGVLEAQTRATTEISTRSGKNHLFSTPSIFVTGPQPVLLLNTFFFIMKAKALPLSINEEKVYKKVKARIQKSTFPACYYPTS
jgi:hypothetical protein